ncbi:MAG: hypothetical protein AVDCRST_MAG39-2873, partial [uncultured Sphingomonadaceae bacterium]
WPGRGGGAGWVGARSRPMLQHRRRRATPPASSSAPPLRG